MTDDPQNPEPASTRPPAEPPNAHGLEPSPLHGLFRALKIFMVPFLFSWALAYVGSAREIEPLYYAGLVGVALCLVVLMIWLIR